MRIYLILIVLVLVSGCKTVPTDISSEYYNIGNAYFDVNNYEKAIEYYIKALEETNPLENKIRFNLAIAYSEADRVSEGLKEFQLLLEEDPENIMVMQSLAYGYYLMGDDDRALSIYDEILSIFEYDTTALFNKSMILIEDDKVEAKVLLEKLYTVDSSIEVTLLLGEIYKDLDDDSYIELYETAIVENQNNHDILIAMIEYYEKQELYYKVIDYIDQLLALSDVEKIPEYLFKKGVIEISELNDFNSGFDSLKKAVDQGFQEKNEIKIFLEKEDLFQSNQLKKYFQEKNLY